MTSEMLAKARKLLEALAEDCTNVKEDGDHDWRKCRACLARAELDHKGIKVLLRAYLATCPELSSAFEDQRFEIHTRAVNDFLNELYAIMVDPCAEGTISVEEMKTALIAAAIRDRDAANARSVVKEFPF